MAVWGLIKIVVAIFQNIKKLLSICINFASIMRSVDETATPFLAWGTNWTQITANHRRSSGLLWQKEGSRVRVRAIRPTGKSDRVKFAWKITQKLSTSLLARLKCGSNPIKIIHTCAGDMLEYGTEYLLLYYIKKYLLYQISLIDTLDYSFL